MILVTRNVNIETYTGKALGAGTMVMVKVDRAGRPASNAVFPLVEIVRP